MTERARARSGTAPEPGDVVYVRYLDHVLFKDVDPSTYAKPFVRETLGWLDYEDDESIRLVWECFAEPDPHREARQRATGLVILKSGILEMRKFSGRRLDIGGVEKREGKQK